MYEKQNIFNKKSLEFLVFFNVYVLFWEHWEVENRQNYLIFGKLLNQIDFDNNMTVGNL